MRPELRVKVEEIATARQEHIASLLKEPLGIAWCAQHSDLADEVVRAVYSNVLSERPGTPPFAVIATGGYGRTELCPHSDIDVTVLPSDDASAELDSTIRHLFQDLHEAFVTVLRMDVGYAYRLISDAPGLDDKTRTGLMDMRLVAGSYGLFEALDRALLESFSAGEFLIAKIRERESMFEKYHDSPLVSEPQLKEGAGGLRCFNCANWIRSSIGERPARATPAYDHVLLVRNLLHLRTGRHQDALTRSRQDEIADLLGLDPIDMMANVVQSGVELHAEYRRATEKIRETRFPLAGGVVAIQGEARVTGLVDAGQAAVGIAIATQLGLAISDLPLAPPTSVHGPAAAYALSRGESTLRNLDRCGLLDALLPELTACRTLVSADSTHLFTVFEHSLRLIRNLDSLEPGSFLGDLKAGLTDIQTLYLAGLLHDVGKRDPHGDHSEVGARIARVVGGRWGLDPSMRETLEWLIREHLTMARFIRIRDIQNFHTVDEFARIVGDHPRLDLLTLLTWADVSAVSPGAWTPAQGTFLRELHARTSARLQGDASSIADPTLSRQRILRHLKSKPEDAERLNGFLESLPLHYMTSTAPDLVRVHLELAERAARGEPSIEMFHRNDISATEVTVCVPDAPGLLSRLLGVFYALDLTVGGIRASTTNSDPPVALDVFTASFGGRPIPSATGKSLTATLLEVVQGSKTVEEVLIHRGKDPTRLQTLFKHTFLPGTPGVLEIQAPRGRGMPFRVSRLIAEQGWNVVAARVSQWAGTAAAAFYIQGPGGKPLGIEEVEEAVHDRTRAATR